MVLRLAGRDYEHAAGAIFNCRGGVRGCNVGVVVSVGLCAALVRGSDFSRNREVQAVPAEGEPGDVRWRSARRGSGGRESLVD